VTSRAAALGVVIPWGRLSRATQMPQKSGCGLVPSIGRAADGPTVRSR